MGTGKSRAGTKPERPPAGGTRRARSRVRGGDIGSHGRHPRGPRRGSAMRTPILVIDGDPTVAVAIRDRLEPEGYDVEAAPDGASGLRLSASRAPALIVLELRLADMPGEAVLREVRRWSAVPILVLSVDDRVEDRVRGL